MGYISFFYYQTLKAFSVKIIKTYLIIFNEYLFVVHFNKSINYKITIYSCHYYFCISVILIKFNLNDEMYLTYFFCCREKDRFQYNTQK